jgi:hypothetical protein
MKPSRWERRDADPRSGEPKAEPSGREQAESSRRDLAVSPVAMQLRQQLQVLRDTGFLSHIDRGVWVVR